MSRQSLEIWEAGFNILSKHGSEYSLEKKHINICKLCGDWRERGGRGQRPASILASQLDNILISSSSHWKIRTLHGPQPIRKLILWKYEVCISFIFIKELSILGRVSATWGYLRVCVDHEASHWMSQVRSPPAIGWGPGRPVSIDTLHLTWKFYSTTFYKHILL